MRHFEIKLHSFNSSCFRILMPLSALQMAVRSLQNLIKVDLRASINPLDKLRSSQIFSIKYKFTLSN